MRAINHALTGAFIGLTVSEPTVALPAAIASHFVLDAIPHHGSQTEHPGILRSRLFMVGLLFDALLCVLLVFLLAGRHPLHWLLAALCAFLAASPDFLWFKRFQLANQHKAWRPGWFGKWAHDIQWFQRPIGFSVEIAWFVAGVMIIIPFLA